MLVRNVSTTAAPALRPALLLAVFCAALVGCSHSATRTFHYRTQSDAGELGQVWASSLDGGDDGPRTGGVHLRLASAAPLLVQTASSGEAVRVFVFVTGKKPIAHGLAGTPLSTPPVSGDVFVVLQAPRGSGRAQVQVLASVAAAHPAPVEAAPTQSDAGGLRPAMTTGARPAHQASAPAHDPRGQPPAPGPQQPGPDALAPLEGVAPGASESGPGGRAPVKPQPKPSHVPVPADEDLSLDDL
jgi:hypothetical protein